MANPKGNRKNLKPWKPGQSGNPKGRPPKGETLTDALRAEFTPEELAAKLRWFIYQKNDLAALKYAYDRVEGTPRQTITQTVREMPKVIRFERASDSDTAKDADGLEQQEEAQGD